ncbi:MAG: YraN family protein [Ignavibacteria bacterium]|nr:YraN family protein [Ignavibacteria bacterium]
MEQKNKSVNIGRKGEQIAIDYLIGKGYKIVKRNFHFGKVGEIDIIASKDNLLVFVEVKIQTSDSFGDPRFWITPNKQAKIRKVAEGFLYVNKLENIESRFDAIFIDFRYQPPKVEHLENAF